MMQRQITEVTKHGAAAGALRIRYARSWSRLRDAGAGRASGAVLFRALDGASFASVLLRMSDAWRIRASLSVTFMDVRD